jgi:hypothetical protein
MASPEAAAPWNYRRDFVCGVAARGLGAVEPVKQVMWRAGTGDRPEYIKKARSGWRTTIENETCSRHASMSAFVGSDVAIV